MQDAIGLLYDTKGFLKNLRTFVRNGGKPGIGDITYIQQRVDKVYQMLRDMQETETYSTQLEKFGAEGKICLSTSGALS